MAVDKRMYKWFIFVIIMGGGLLLLAHRRLTPNSNQHFETVISHFPTAIPTQTSKIVAQPHVNAVSCQKLFQGDESTKNDALSFMRLPVDPIPAYGYNFPRSACKRFIYGRGYTMDPMTREERDFPIAFSIVMFKDVAQVERLLRAIYRPQNYYCIHIDKKANSDIHRAMRSIADCFDNVFLASKFYYVRWGELSVLEVEMQCMRDLLQYKSWRYFINLTGQEFPLKTNWQLVKILKVMNGANDMEGTMKR